MKKYLLTLIVILSVYSMHVRIDVSSLSPGVYFVSVDGRMYKFVKIY